MNRLALLLPLALLACGGSPDPVARGQGAPETGGAPATLTVPVTAGSAGAPLTEEEITYRYCQTYFVTVRPKCILVHSMDDDASYQPGWCGGNGFHRVQCGDVNVGCCPP